MIEHRVDVHEAKTRLPQLLHQTTVPRHPVVSATVIDGITRHMPCLGKEWWS